MLAYHFFINEIALGSFDVSISVLLRNRSEAYKKQIRNFNASDARGATLYEHNASSVCPSYFN